MKSAEAFLFDGREVAFIDVREPLDFGTAHPFLVVNIPLGRLEIEMGSRVPRLSTRIIISDGGEGLAERAAACLSSLGYMDIQVLDGGAPAWKSAGHELFMDVEVPVKAFTGFAEYHGHPEFISPVDLKVRIDLGAPTLILDTRPLAEYSAGHVPEAYNAPGPDVLRAAASLAADPATLIVVNCMSRTRGILGCLSLRNSGLPNRVVTLRDGTYGWRLGGFDLERGPGRTVPSPTLSALFVMRAHAARLVEKARIPTIAQDTFDDWLTDRGRTTVVLDVRDSQDFGEGHLPGSVSAPAGTAIMTPDRFVATMNARVVIIDDDDIRASVTAYWWHQFGWYEVALLRHPFAKRKLESGMPKRRLLGLNGDSIKTYTPNELQLQLQESGVALIDLSYRDSYRAGHVPSSAWALRTDLPSALKQIQPLPQHAILTSEDGTLARLAAQDLIRVNAGKISLAGGGVAAWKEAGLPLQSGEGLQLSRPIDRWLRSYERVGDVNANIRAYLEWETSLLDQVKRDGVGIYRSCLE